MVIAVLVTVAVMLFAADPLADFIHGNPTLVMLALGFLLLIGTTLVAEALRRACPQGLHLQRHGVLGAGRAAEHALPSSQAAPGRDRRPN